MGLSFENLLKGLIVAQRGKAGNSGIVDRDLTTHRMKDLVDLLDPSICISTDEKRILEDLQHYVVWAGRYPLPKKQGNLFAMGRSNHEYELMLSLWDRLFNILHSVGWVKKMGDFKLWTDPMKNQPGG